MSQDAATIIIFSNVNNPLFCSNCLPITREPQRVPKLYSILINIFLSNYYNPNIIHLYEYDNSIQFNSFILSSCKAHLQFNRHTVRTFQIQSIHTIRKDSIKSNAYRAGLLIKIKYK